MATARLTAEAKSCVRQYVGGGSRLDEVEFLVVRYCYAPTQHSLFVCPKDVWTKAVAVNRSNGCIFVLTSQNEIVVIDGCGRRVSRFFAPCATRVIEYHDRLNCLVAIDSHEGNIITFDFTGRCKVACEVADLRRCDLGFSIDRRTGHVFVAVSGKIVVLDTRWWREIRRMSVPNIAQVKVGVHPKSLDSVLFIQRFRSNLNQCYTTTCEDLTFGTSNGDIHPTLPIYWRLCDKGILFFDLRHNEIASDPITSGPILRVDALDDGRTFIYSMRYRSDSGTLCVQESSLVA